MIHIPHWHLGTGSDANMKRIYRVEVLRVRAMELLREAMRRYTAVSSGQRWAKAVASTPWIVFGKFVGMASVFEETENR